MERNFSYTTGINFFISISAAIGLLSFKYS